MVCLCEWGHRVGRSRLTEGPAAVCSSTVEQFSQTGMPNTRIQQHSVEQFTQTGMPNPCTQQNCFPTQPNAHAKQRHSATRFPNSAKQARQIAIFSCTVVQLSQTGMLSSRIKQHPLPTHQNRHAKQPYPAALFANSGKQGCQAAVFSNTVFQLSQKGMSNTPI